MLSASIATVKGLAADTSSEFDGRSAEEGKVSSGRGTDAVWFDIFGEIFVVFQLHTLFAISVTLLVVTPMILIGFTILLVQLDKFYLFSGKKLLLGEDEPVNFDGWRAIFRFPVSFALAGAGTVGLAFVVTKVNPYIISSSEYSVWR
jgi:hypothetical protein